MLQSSSREQYLLHLLQKIFFFHKRSKESSKVESVVVNGVMSLRREATQEVTTVLR